MNKRTLHRPLALLLALALTLTLTSVPALAEDGENGTDGASDLPKSTVTSVKVGGETLTKSNQKNAAGTATFDGDKLILDKYSGGGISASKGNLTIVVKGTNRVNEPNSWGIQLWHGSLTIQGEGTKTDSLTVHSSNTALMSYGGALTVSNLAALNCSSTTSVNPIIDTHAGAITFSNIGTMLVRGNTSYPAVYGDTASPMKFTNIDTLEVLNDKDEGIVAQGGLIMNCKTVLAFSKSKEAIYIYGRGATITADRLIAVGRAGVHEYVNGSHPVDLSAVNSMLVAGQSEAMHGSIITKQPVKNFEHDSWKICTYPANLSGLNQAEISITGAVDKQLSITYTGKPIEVNVSATPKEGGTLPEGEAMTYIYAWYDKNDVPLMEAPTDVGEYKVKVYGFSEHYYSDFNNPAEATVTITPADVPNSYEKTLAGTIGNGYNIYTLPEIPEGMKYGTLTGVPEGWTATVGGGKLSVNASGLTSTSQDTTLKVPVIQGSNKNYNDYEITCTFTANVPAERALFNLCDGSPVKTVKTTEVSTAIQTGLYDKDSNETGAWQSDIATAKEFGYTFEGWYTAPNGWGTPANGTYTPGTTYFAHWVATRAVAGYANVPGKDDPQLVYVQFADGQRRTVYTTGLDFTNDSMPPANNGEYEWKENRLTLKGVLVNSGTSSTALTLPGKAKIYLGEDTRMTKATAYYTENSQEPITETTAKILAKAAAYNNFYGGGDKIPSMQVGQEDASEEETPDTAALTAEAPEQEYGLTISSENDACAFSVRGGEATVVGNLTLNNATLSTQGISVLGDLTFDKTSMLAAVDPNDAQTRDLNLFVSGSLDASGMLIVDGDITAEGQINLHDGATLMSWGALQSNEINLSQLNPTSACDRLESLGTITLNNATLSLDGMVEGPIASVRAANLTVENGSTLEVSSYDRYGIFANQMTVRNSTVKVGEKGGEKGALVLPNTEGKNGNLTLERARVTGPNGVRIETDELGQRAMVGDALSDTLLIQPYHSSSSGSSNYTVKVNETKNGTVTPSATRVGSGSTVTLTVEPDGGYVLDSITAKDAAGKDVSLTKTADGKYTFKMPSSAVTVNASFRLRFTDVDPNAWYFKGVQDSVKKGLMEGMSETIFAPNGTLTRAQLVTILWRMEQQPSVNYAMPFTDVADGQWYTEAVRWAASTKVVNGTSATTFTPDAPVTREQLVAMLWRYAKQKGYDVSIGEETNILSYADATSVSEYAIPAMQWACGSGIIQGADGKLLPRDSTTRAQIATIFQRFGALKA